MNERAPEMWRIISEQIDFKGRSVVDYGFGGGDMLIYAYRAGAQEGVLGIERDEGNIRRMEERMRQEGIPPRMIPLSLDDIDKSIGRNWFLHDEIAFCFSVLPYLEDPSFFLDYLSRYHALTFLECQYEGDGPGFRPDGKPVFNDEDMFAYLSNFHWKQIEAVGKTLVADRNRSRTIWMLQS